MLAKTVAEHLTLRNFSTQTSSLFHHAHNAQIRNPIKSMPSSLFSHFCNHLVHVYKQWATESVMHFCHRYANALLLGVGTVTRQVGFDQLWSQLRWNQDETLQLLVCKTSRLLAWKENNGSFWWLCDVWMVLWQIIITTNLNIVEREAPFSLNQQSEDMCFGGLRVCRFYTPGDLSDYFFLSG